MEGFKAKSFCVVTPRIRRNLVRRHLLSRRAFIVDSELDAEQFDSLMESVDWGGEGKLTLKSEVENAGGVRYTFIVARYAKP